MHEKAIFSNDLVDVKQLPKRNETSDNLGKKNEPLKSLMHENVMISLYNYLGLLNKFIIKC